MSHSNPHSTLHILGTSSLLIGVFIKIFKASHHLTWEGSIRPAYAWAAQGSPPARVHWELHLMITIIITIACPNNGTSPSSDEVTASPTDQPGWWLMSLTCPPRSPLWPLWATRTLFSAKLGYSAPGPPPSAPIHVRSITFRKDLKRTKLIFPQNARFKNVIFPIAESVSHCVEVALKLFAAKDPSCREPLHEPEKIFSIFS